MSPPVIQIREEKTLRKRIVDAITPKKVELELDATGPRLSVVWAKDESVFLPLVEGLDWVELN